MTDGKGTVVEKGKKYIGEATNNFAEYSALIFGLERARKLKIARLACFSDSELMVKQLTGEYRVKNSELRERFLKVGQLLKDFESVVFTAVPREKNRLADRLVNEAIDAATS